MPKRVKIPRFLQGVLWSVPVEMLDLKKDKVYIINQVLAYGSLSDYRWLFQNYPQRNIAGVFLNHPIKTYLASTFHFVKDFILNTQIKFPLERYVLNTPRIIG